MQALIGRRHILEAKDAIETFRDQCQRDEPVLTSIDWFLSKRTVWNEIPVVLISRHDDTLTGVVMLYFSTACGIPFGLARGGRRGDVSVIAPRHQQRQLLETGARFLVKHMFAHTVVFTVPYAVPRDTAGFWAESGPDEWFTRSNAHRLNLAGGLDATMQRFSYKLRRNLRYYRRRASNEGRSHFVSEMTRAQRDDAVTILAGKGRYSMSLPQARNWDRALQALPGAFAMGLQNAAGDWLSYVVGWREPTATYIDWQLNDESDATATVMRSHLIEHESARATPALVFVGGTSPIWQRACDPALASDLLVTSTGPLSRLFRAALERFRPQSDVSLLLQRRRSHGAAARAPVAIAARDIRPRRPAERRHEAALPIPSDD